MVTMINIGEDPPPVSSDDEAIILKILHDQDGDPDLMMWTNVATPDNVLIMLAASIQVVVTAMVKADDHE
jgi:hypothetical protein